MGSVELNHKRNLITNMEICASIITWNNLNDTRILINSLLHERLFFFFGEKFVINICDNGSGDETKGFLDEVSVKNKDVNIFHLKENMGISVAKNILIRNAVGKNFKFMFMFDNDVEVINGSLKEMIKFMELNKDAGCFGQHIDFYCKDINSPKICKNFPKIEDLEIEKNVKSGCGATRSWTHYSIYKCDVFRDGVMFDEEGAFGCAGYGFDDDDLGMQIKQAGYNIYCFKNLYCYHNINSSVSELEKRDGIMYSEREKYFYHKWRGKI